MVGTNSRCPFYRGVRLIEVSVKRKSTVEHYNNVTIHQVTNRKIIKILLLF